jgi:lactoylglutathione lyase
MCRLRCLTVRALHVGLRVIDLERSLAFYRAVGYTVVGTVEGTPFGGLTMLRPPGDSFVTIELVHDPVRGAVDLGTGINHLVVQVDSRDAIVADLAWQGSQPSRPGLLTARTSRGLVGSPTRTATGSSWFSGRRVMQWASRRPTSPEPSRPLDSWFHPTPATGCGPGSAQARVAPCRWPGRSNVQARAPRADIRRAVSPRCTEPVSRTRLSCRRRGRRAACARRPPVGPRIRSHRRGSRHGGSGTRSPADRAVRQWPPPCVR